MARVRRTVVAALATASLLLSLAASTSLAATGPGREPPGPALADRDGNGISDELQARLRKLPSDRRVNVVVTFDGPGNADSARKAVGPFRVIRRFELIRGFAASMTVAQVRALATRAEVFRIESNFRVQTTMDAADRDFGTEAARSTFDVDGSGVEVCVVDTGVNPAHEQLDSKAPIPFYDAVNGQTTAYDDHGHGTHVASIAAGDGTGGANAGTYGGVAPGASLSAAKVLSSFGFGTADQVIAGIQWCAGRSSARVISMSLGGSTASDGSDSISQAVNAAVDGGKVVVVAAGNSGDAPETVGSPGAAAKALTVGAVAEFTAPLSAPNHSNGVHLAYFSSRGPTLDGRTKPDVVAPGVSITAADAANTSGYITYSGTSMATPFVSGTVALALDADPGWTPTQVRSAVEGTAQGRGPSGKDDDWGAGLLDGMAVVAQAAGGAGTTAFPAHTRIDASVADHGTWTYEFSLGSGDLGTPIGVTIIIDGQLECVLWWGSLCLQQNWGPDLDAQLIAPNGSVIDESTCTADTACGVGRQETLATMPTVEGTYTIKVYPWEGEPFNGRGGSFGVDLSAGSTVAPAPSPSPSPPPPPPPTIHVGDIDDTSAPYNSKQWTARARFEVHDGAEAVVAGVRVNVAWQNGKTANCTTNTNGRCSVSRRVTVKKATFSVSVTGLVLSGYNYVSSDNHDPDGDSDGTSITLHRP